MSFKINNFFLLIILILLQSCSGGRIGNFLESSFKNNQEPKIKEGIKNLENKLDTKFEKKSKDNKDNEEPKTKEDIKNLENKLNTKFEKKSKNNNKITEENLSFQKKQYLPKSYKIIFILKDVDPKDPTENLRSILRDSDVNFEIEKIELFFDPNNKSIKRD